MTGQKLRAKPLDSRRPSKKALSLISLLIVGAACLLGGASARDSKILNGDGVKYKLESQRFAEEEHARKRSHPIVGQETDDYDNYTVYKEPFSKTEDYLKMNYFIIGMKLADTYKYTDPCLNNVVGAADSSAYFENHMYDHEKLMETGERSTYF